MKGHAIKRTPNTSHKVYQFVFHYYKEISEAERFIKKKRFLYLTVLKAKNTVALH